jgi:hypothetical protein
VASHTARHFIPGYEAAGSLCPSWFGVFGLKNTTTSQSTFNQIATNKQVAVSSQHSAIQGMLIELGNFYGYDTYTADPNANFDEKRLEVIPKPY